MINELGNCHEETVIANNEKEAKSNVQTFNPRSKVLKAIFVERYLKHQNYLFTMSGKHSSHMVLIGFPLKVLAAALYMVGHPSMK